MEIPKEAKEHIIKQMRHEKTPLRMITKSLAPYLKYTMPYDWDASNPSNGRIILVPFKIPDAIVKVSNELAKVTNLPGVTGDTIVADLANIIINKGLSDIVVESYSPEDIKNVEDNIENIIKGEDI